MTNLVTGSTATRELRFPLSAHLVMPRRRYTHHGTYVGSGQLVHYKGLSLSLRRGRVAEVGLVEFAHSHPVRIHDDAEVAYSGIEVVARACSSLGEDAYDLLRNNCEHFCPWCLIGAARSLQVERLLSSSRAIALAAQVLACLVNGWGSARDALPFTN